MSRGVHPSSLHEGSRDRDHGQGGRLQRKGPQVTNLRFKSCIWSPYARFLQQGRSQRPLGT